MTLERFLGFKQNGAAEECECANQIAELWFAWLSYELGIFRFASRTREKYFSSVQSAVRAIEVVVKATRMLRYYSDEPTS